jgi:small subunit ribosomal protein S4
LLPNWQRVNEDAHLRWDDLEPRRNFALAGLGARNHERREVDRARSDLDDVVLGHPERRDVDLATIDQEVSVADQLASHVARLGEAGEREVPAWIEVIPSKMRILVHSLPVRQQIDSQLQEQLIVELYSK